MGIRRPLRAIVPFAALLPMALTVIVGYLGTVLWSLKISLTNSRSFPSDTFVGMAQYTRLFENERWLLSTWRCTGFCSSWPAW